MYHHQLDCFIKDNNTSTWKITDPSTLEKIKSGTNGLIESPMFILFSPFKWYLAFNPNLNDTDAAIFLFMTALSPKIHSVHLRCRYIFVEGNVDHAERQTLSAEQTYCLSWGAETLLGT